MTNEELLDGFEIASKEYNGPKLTELRAELLRLLGAAVLASAHPMCPKCKSDEPNNHAIVGLDDGTVEANCLCGFSANLTFWADFAQFFAAAPAQEPPPDLLVQDLAMLVRRLLRKHPNLELVAQAKDFLMRKGLQGSILRTAAQEQPVENSPCTCGFLRGSSAVGSKPCPKCSPQKGKS